MKRQEILNRISQLEKEGKFSEHIWPINEDKIKYVEPTYDYLRRGFWNQLGSFFTRPIFAFAGLLFGAYFNLKIVGKENLKKVKNGIIVSNHIHKLDVALIKRAFIGKKIYITTAEFNNFKGIGGSLLRSAGTLPLSPKYSCVKNFNKAVETILNKDGLIVFYPEGSLWWCYEKPRPNHAGAFFYAAKNNVPIIPLFFTFKNKRKRKDGTYVKKFVLNIGKPIFPIPEKNFNENKIYLQEEYEKFTKETYEKFYNKKLI